MVEYPDIMIDARTREDFVKEFCEILK